MASYEIKSPHNGALYKTVSLATADNAKKALQLSGDAQKEWKKVSLEERKRIVERFVEFFVAEKEEIASELASSIGRYVFAFVARVNTKSLL